MVKLAPIVLFVYNRPEHTRKTIKSLQENKLSSESELFIFSDAPRNENDIEDVKMVRDVINEINGFKNITVIKAEHNRGLANSVINGITEIINKYGTVIVLEDDLITSPNFLSYMNESLNFYSENLNVWSISGYTPDIKFPEGYNDEIYLSLRGCSWGWATWKHQWDLVDWNVSDYDSFKSSLEKRRKFNMGGNDLSYMLDDQMASRINSWAIRWVYSQHKQNKYTIYPVNSLVSNIGLDFSGTHSSNSDKYKTKEIHQGHVKFTSNCKVNRDILGEFKSFYDLNTKGYLGVLARRTGTYKYVRKIMKKLAR
ncbi:sugar transferase [Bacillus toyonensis]|uniref:glycosyltransferase n=1 Tax=Bacillus toyonensis TaxID=155322 RepID=UPI000BFB936B|nr:glycosyltransferase [Bacillus toyonensis]PHC41187.1 sugar transferase [Bacillus toyonensis]